MLPNLPIPLRLAIFVKTFVIFPFPLILDMMFRDPTILVKKSIAVIYGLFLVLGYSVSSSWILAPLIAYGLMEVILRMMLSMAV